MTVLVTGASGATGRLLTGLLLDRGCRVKVLVRSASRLPDHLRRHEGLTSVEGSVLDMSEEQRSELVAGCSSIASCLGHSINVRGIWGPPYRLVTRSVECLCEAVRANRPDTPVRFVLMNTAGNRNRDLPEPVAIREHMVLGLLRLLIPPHRDNECAADYLRTRVGGEDPFLEWAAVRPDTLLHRDEVTPYELHPSPVRSAIFHAGETSRINVAHFMAALMTEDGVWAEWKGRMPVIYNTGA